MADDPVPGSEVSLHALSPRLMALLEEDLAGRKLDRALTEVGDHDDVAGAERHRVVAEVDRLVHAKEADILAV